MWLIFLWGAAVPFFMAIDGEVRPESWADGLAGAFGILVAIGIVMLFAPRFAGMWAMGFAVGSVVALVVAPIKGYPMLDIGFGVQAVGGWGLMALSTVVWDRKKERALRNDPVAMMQMRAMEDAMASVLGGVLTAQGEVHPLLTTIPEMSGPGRARVEPGGPLVFTLHSSGRSHKIELKYIKSVKAIDQSDEYLSAGTLWFDFVPSFPFSISIMPSEDDREKWLALAPKANSAS